MSTRLKSSNESLATERAYLDALGDHDRVSAIDTIRRWLHTKSTDPSLEECERAQAALAHPDRPWLQRLADPILAARREAEARETERRADEERRRQKHETAVHARLVELGMENEPARKLLVEAFDGVLAVVDRTGQLDLRELEAPLQRAAALRAAVAEAIGLERAATVGAVLAALDTIGGGAELERVARATVGIGPSNRTSGDHGLSDQATITHHVNIVQARLAGRKVAAAR